MNFEFANRIKGVDGSAIAEILKYAGDPTFISLAGGNPAAETFPAAELAEIASDILKENPVLTLQYNQPKGFVPLREVLTQRLKTNEKVGASFDDLAIVSGGQQAIDYAAKIFCNEGDTVLVEEPSYIGALNSFRSYGAKLVGIAMEDDGINIEALEKAIEDNSNIKVLYTIPTFQNPTGITMSASKRKAVYDICRKNQIIIIEDNPYGELRFQGQWLPSIKSLDTEGIVVYCGSFSKILAPGLRIGFVVAHETIIGKIVDQKQGNDVHTSMMVQRMVYTYLTRYDIDASIEKMRILYKRKCAVMLDAIETYFPKTVTHTNPWGGLFVWCDLHGDYETRVVAKQCEANKVVFVPGSTFMVDMDKPCSALRLNYSTMEDERIVEGVKLLGAALHEIMGVKA